MFNLNKQYANNFIHYPESGFLGNYYFLWKFELMTFFPAQDLQLNYLKTGLDINYPFTFLTIFLGYCKWNRSLWVLFFLKRCLFYFFNLFSAHH